MSDLSHTCYRCGRSIGTYSCELRALADRPDLQDRFDADQERHGGSGGNDQEPDARARNSVPDAIRQLEQAHREEMAEAKRLVRELWEMARLYRHVDIEHWSKRVEGFLKQ